MAMTRRAVLKGLVAAGVGVATGTGAYGYLYGRRGLGVTYATLPVNGLPAALSGLRIGLLTDVHRSRWMSDDDLARAVNMLMVARPDLIVLGGDYVTWGDRRYIGPSADALGPLAAPDDVVAVPGSQDDGAQVSAGLAA